MTLATRGYLIARPTGAPLTSFKNYASVGDGATDPRSNQTLLPLPDKEQSKKGKQIQNTATTGVGPLLSTWTALAGALVPQHVLVIGFDRSIPSPLRQLDQDFAFHPDWQLAPWSSVPASSIKHPGDDIMWSKPATQSAAKFTAAGTSTHSAVKLFWRKSAAATRRPEARKRKEVAEKEVHAEEVK
ncbi:hypothetical protein B0H15DRAFT_806178 [Mycena belliarum]|uniref:Uncharacterized protein n=1 Tax=Mycena belliarum TaxID=1033014 RepID=A0AAD6TP85_9AGAR|nr:hypothetical protein B0H15DRAFT_1010599 [Mycena belliae]KAJ7075448.1 hypothetical protein B0H15DRAFT_806178 [Mycena belliae]